MFEICILEVSIEIWASKPVIPPEICYGFPQFLQTNDRMVS